MNFAVLIGTLISLGLTIASEVAQKKQSENRVSLSDAYDVIRTAASEAATKGGSILKKLENKLLSLNLNIPSQNIKNIVARETAKLKSLRDEVETLNADVNLYSELAAAESMSADESTGLFAGSKKEKERTKKSKEAIESYGTKINQAKDRLSEIEEKI